MSLKLDDFINSVINHKSVKQGEGEKESAELLSKDALIEEVIEAYKKYSDIELKKQYGGWIIAVLVIWVLFVGTFCFFQLWVEKPMSDGVLITLLTTTTINILALPTIILRSLFPHKH